MKNKRHLPGIVLTALLILSLITAIGMIHAGALGINLTKTADRIADVTERLPDPEDLPSAVNDKDNLAVTGASGTSGSCTWKYDAGTKTLTISGKGEMLESVPAAGSSTASPWYAYRAEIEHVKVNEGVTALRWAAFYQCTAVKDISLPSTLTSLPRYCFGNNHNLTSLNIPAGVKDIDAEVFRTGMTSLQTITVSDKNQYFCAYKGHLYNKKRTAFLYFAPGSKTTNFSLPESVTAIRSGAFRACTNLESVRIGKASAISDEAFQSCTGLKNVVIGTGVRTIGQRAFDSCTALEFIVIPSGVNTIDEYAFAGCSNLLDVRICSGVKSIKRAAFSGTAVESILIPKSVTEIDPNYTLGYAAAGSAVNLTVYGYNDSAAQTYCAYNSKHTFVSVDKAVTHTYQNNGTDTKLCTKADGSYRVTAYNSSSAVEEYQSLVPVKDKVRAVFATSFTPDSNKDVDIFGPATLYLPTANTKATVYRMDVDNRLTKVEKTRYADGYIAATIYDTGVYVIVAPDLDTPVISKLANVYGGVKITWGKVSGAEKYRVFRKSGKGGWTTVGNTTSTSLTDKTAKNGVKYSYTVRCISKKGNVYTSGYDTKGKSISYIASAKIIAIDNICAGARLRWSKVTGAASYRVFIKSGGKWKKLADTAAASYTHTAAKSNKTYTYTVRALNQKGKYIASYNTKGQSNRFFAAPKITGFSNGNSGARLKWGKVAGAAKYRVYIKKGKDWQALGKTAATSYLHRAAKGGATYAYTVRAEDKNGKLIGSYHTGGWKNKYISAPGLPALKNTKNGVQLSWKKVSGAQRYRVYRKTGSGGWKQLGDTTSLKFVDTAAVNGKTYTYTVRCVSKDGKKTVSGYDTTGKSIICKR